MKRKKIIMNKRNKNIQQKNQLFIMTMGCNTGNKGFVGGVVSSSKKMPKVMGSRIVEVDSDFNMQKSDINKWKVVEHSSF